MTCKTRLLLLGFIALALAACGTDGSSEQKPEFDGTLYDIVYGPAGDVPLNDSVERIVASCMAESGWEYTPNEGSAVASFVALGISELEFAQTYGFGLTRQPDIPQSPANAANFAYVQGLAPAAKVQYADNLKVCDLKAKTEVDVKAAAVGAVLQKYREDVLTRLFVTDDGQAAIAGWRTCLQTPLADTATTTFDVVQSVDSYLKSAGLSEQDAWAFEVGIATKAVGCDEGRKIAEHDALVVLEDEFVDSNREAVQQILDLYRESNPS